MGTDKPKGEVDVQRADPLAEFKAKLQAKVRSDIADLLPESAVAQMVNEAVRDTFFASRKKNVGSDYSPRWEDRPSWFVEAVAEAAKPILQKAVEDYIAANQGVVADAVAKYLTPQNLTLLAVGRLSVEISMAIENLARAVRDRQMF